VSYTSLNINGTRDIACCMLLLAALCSGNRSSGQGYSPAQALEQMTVADGFTVELVASEPLVRQPVAIEFDDRGRLWVIQYLQYPNPAGLTRVEVDRYSRIVYDRVPKPPPHGPKGADRITILEDTDGDGRADQAKDFVAGLNLASGLAFGHGGLFVLNAPYLLFYPDRDRDDVPDDDPEVLLNGFGMQDASSVANSLTWGPDGWIYGCQGSTVTANIRGIEFQQGVWRYHPVTKQFELFCEGGGNSWGLDFERDGHLLYSTNVGDYVMFHGMQGAYLWKKFHKHGALHNPYTFGYFDHVPHEGFRGGHVTVGGILYRGTAFPPEFRGTYIGADLLDHAVYWHSVKRNGSTFASKHGGELLLANDAWFAPTDVALGPAGAIYVADWYDERTAHPDPDADWDRSNGRIYRIRATGSQPEPQVDLNSLSSTQLVDRLADRNDWYARRAARILAERRDKRTYALLGKLIFERDAVPTANGEKTNVEIRNVDEDKNLPVEALWALYASGGFHAYASERLLEHIDQYVRMWTVRFLGDQRTVTPPTLTALVRLASRDPSPDVRAQLACTARRLPPEQGLTIVASLVSRDEDAADPCIPLLLWWAVEHHAVAAPEPTLSLFASQEIWQSKLARQTLLPRLMRRYAAEADEPSLTVCARLLASAPCQSDKQTLLAELDRGLELAGSEANPTVLAKTLETAWDVRTDDPTMIRLAIRCGIRKAHERAVRLAVDRSIDQRVRLAMLDILDDVGQADCVELLLALVGDNEETESVRHAALGVLDRFSSDQISSYVLRHYPEMNTSLRSRARSLLFSRKPWAMLFLQDVDRGRLDQHDVSLGELRRTALHGDARIDELVRKHWGAIRAATPEEKLAEVRRLNNDLNAGKGDRTRGRVIFEKTCATCHQLFGEGTQLGPDLTHVNRKDRSFLLVSLVDPSVQIRKEYLSFIVETEDGRVQSGMIVDQTPSAVTLLTAKNERVPIRRDEIETLRESSVSLMPDDQMKQLDPQQLRDLFVYLQEDAP